MNVNEKYVSMIKIAADNEQLLVAIFLRKDSGKYDFKSLQSKQRASRVFNT